MAGRGTGCTAGGCAPAMETLAMVSVFGQVSAPWLLDAAW